MISCDPTECDNCQYIGDGTFICDKYDVPLIVIDDWDETINYLICSGWEYQGEDPIIKYCSNCGAKMNEVT